MKNYYIVPVYLNMLNQKSIQIVLYNNTQTIKDFSKDEFNKKNYISINYTKLFLYSYTSFELNKYEILIVNVKILPR